jgi:hypothetical protein
VIAFSMCALDHHQKLSSNIYNARYTETIFLVLKMKNAPLSTPIS